MERTFLVLSSQKLMGLTQKGKPQHGQKAMRVTKLFIIYAVSISLFSLIPLSCILPFSSFDEIYPTKTALSLGQTQLAQTAAQRTISPSSTTINTTLTSKTPTISPQVTIETLTPTTSQQIIPTETNELETHMKSTNILLYEDMVENRDAKRYIRDTLDYMELPYVDLGSAEGWLKSNMVSGTPDGEDWDLIIIASEAKQGISGEFFQYINDALDKEISIILEIGYLDIVSNSSAKPLLSRCGVKFQSDWRKIHPSRMVMFPLASTHPILNNPNSGLSFTNVTNYWWDPSGENVYDIGDRIELTFDGDALLLIGTSAIDKNRNGTLTNCIHNHLTMQTFSSHQISYDTMQLLWENYIYNALKIRLHGSY